MVGGESPKELLDRVSEAIWDGMPFHKYAESVGMGDKLYGQIRGLGYKPVETRRLVDARTGECVTPAERCKPGVPHLGEQSWQCLARVFVDGGYVPEFAKIMGQNPQTVYTQVKRAGLEIRVIKRVLVNQVTGEEYLPPSQKCKSS